MYDNQLYNYSFSSIIKSSSEIGNGHDKVSNLLIHISISGASIKLKLKSSKRGSGFCYLQWRILLLHSIVVRKTVFFKDMLEWQGDKVLPSEEGRLRFVLLKTKIRPDKERTTISSWAVIENCVSGSSSE